MNRMSVQAFYDDFAPLYHLVYENWEANVARQGKALASLIGEHWGAGARTVLDAAVGIGTQALGLLALGFRVTGSDLSHAAVNRAWREAAARHLPLSCVVADYPTILKSSYLAIPVAQVAELMSAVGFQGVRRVDDRFFQPVLVGTRPVV